LDISLFDFQLPENLIAQTPLKQRTASRLLVLHKRTGEIEHRAFIDLIDYLIPGDMLVLNNTRVIPARLLGVKQETQAKIEILLLKQLNGDHWEVLVKPGKKVREGDVVEFGTGQLRAVCESTTAAGGRIIRFEYKGIFTEVLDQLGSMPLPPYIKEQLQEPERYQTVYAETPGSSAAPTAGLHFTDSYLQACKEKGIEVAYVTLHVGLGTFRPVQVEKITEHQMHAESYMVTEENARRIQAAKTRGNRVLAVGTTSARTLETIGSHYEGKVAASSGDTNIFIYPGYSFQVVDALLTNFHLPKSTLVMMVSALAGRENIMNAYAEAVKEEYRFFSFGDAMLII
jgi:S-adenosylmethionine:tRNA ribosyltransferase-isomerase